MRFDYHGTVHAARAEDATPRGVRTLCGHWIRGEVAKLEPVIWDIPERLFCGGCQWTKEMRCAA